MYSAVERVRAAAKAHREAKQRTWLVISVSGLKIRDFDSRELRDSYALYQISFITWLPSNPQVILELTLFCSTHLDAAARLGSMGGKWKQRAGALDSPRLASTFQSRFDWFQLT